MAFERIPLGWEYETLKSLFYNKTDGVNDPRERTLFEAVDISIDYFFEGYIEENGMKRVAMVILGFLYEMDHGDVDPHLARAVKWHIEDFEEGDEEGNYESLFKPEDLKTLKEDIRIIKDYIENHPESLN